MDGNTGEPRSPSPSSTSQAGSPADLPQPRFRNEFVTRDPKVVQILELVQQVADTDATVLIIGETGTGKELIAKALHQQSSRKQSPFIAVNCGAIAESLQESELFGHEKGAFTGASDRRIGKFEAADNGTVFLDEISEMTRALQVKLLRILQSGEYVPVGKSTSRHCDVRVVAASNEELGPRITSGKFRKDLYYRLNIIRIELPPLRDRLDDIPLLADHFLSKFGVHYQKPGITIDASASKLLQQYDYPGNIRELENIIRRATILCQNGIITHDLLPSEILNQPVAQPSFPQSESFQTAKNLVVENFEREFLIANLRHCGGIVSRAAQRCGLSERNFHSKLKKYGIQSKSFRG